MEPSSEEVQVREAAFNREQTKNILIFIAVLLIALALGYLLYTQLLMDKGQGPVNEPQKNLVEFDMTTFDQHEIDSRTELLKARMANDTSLLTENEVELTRAEREALMVRTVGQ